MFGVIGADAIAISDTLIMLNRIAGIEFHLMESFIMTTYTLG